MSTTNKYKATKDNNRLQPKILWVTMMEENGSIIHEYFQSGPPPYSLKEFT